MRTVQCDRCAYESVTMTPTLREGWQLFFDTLLCRKCIELIIGDRLKSEKIRGTVF